MRPDTLHHASLYAPPATMEPPACPLLLRGAVSPGMARRAAALLVVMALFLFSLAAPALAAESTELVLVDGTVVRGTLNSFNDGIYTIKSNTLGTLRIEAAKVKNIRIESHPGSSQEALQTLQQRMEGDAAIMDLVKSLQQDPDFQEILKDEEVVRAITSGDLSTLEHNKKILELTNKPGVRAIEQKLRSPQ